MPEKENIDLTTNRLSERRIKRGRAIERRKKVDKTMSKVKVEQRHALGDERKSQEAEERKKEERKKSNKTEERVTKERATKRKKERKSNERK